MKFHLIVLFAFATLLTGLTSCVNPATGKVSAVTTAQNVEPFVRPGASAIGVGLIAIAPVQDQKLARAKWLFAVATVIRTISASAPPSEAQFRTALTAITPKEENDWLQVVISLSSLYSGFRAQFGTNTAIILAAIEQIALGLEDAAKPYVSAT
jgi:hypothetical protein